LDEEGRFREVRGLGRGEKLRIEVGIGREGDGRRCDAVRGRVQERGRWG
jgi:hypothetical protein